VEVQSKIAPVRDIFDAARTAPQPDEITLRHALNEAWFSDALAWLLDPRRSHGLGVSFLRGFLKAVARERSNSDKQYARRASHLKWSSTPGRGAHISGLRLSNASVLREFYLTAAVAASSNRGNRYADVVALDLDPNDELFLVVENKLFGSNHTG
jgi:hypothetical protein